jgi:hypothetical protein
MSDEDLALIADLLSFDRPIAGAAKNWIFPAAGGGLELT